MHIKSEQTDICFYNLFVKNYISMTDEFQNKCICNKCAQRLAKQYRIGHIHVLYTRTWLKKCPERRKPHLVCVPVQISLPV